MLFCIIICFRETSGPAQPQSPTHSQNQRQFQHVKASKSMDLGTNPQHTGGEILMFIYSAWWLHASYHHSDLNIPADAWLWH